MGKKNIDLVTRRNALRGRKSKEGGKIIKGYGIIYTPALNRNAIISSHIPPTNFDISLMKGERKEAKTERFRGGSPKEARTNEEKSRTTGTYLR